MKISVYRCFGSVSWATESVLPTENLLKSCLLGYIAQPGELLYKENSTDGFTYRRAVFTTQQ